MAPSPPIWPPSSRRLGGAAGLDGDPEGGLGLDSLAAVELKGRVERDFGVDLPLADLLGPSSVERLKDEILSRLDRAAASSAAPESAAVLPPSGEFPLSHGQQALWFLYRLAPESAAYNLWVAARLGPQSDPALLRRGIAALVERHPALRTVFGERDGEPFQRIEPRSELAWKEVDAAGWDERELRVRVREEAERSFDLELGPPLRLCLWYRGPGDALVLLVIHHLIGDFWSLALAARELAALCAPAALGPPPASTFAGHVESERRRLASAAGEELWGYWREKLSGGLPTLSLPTDRPRPPVQGYRGAAHLRFLSPQIAERLPGLARRGATQFVVLLSAYAALLAQRTGQRDLLIGSPAASRRDPALADVFGYFVNPLVLHADLVGDPRFTEILERLQAEAVAALEHQDFPFALAAQRLGVEHDPSRSPVFQTLFSFHRAPAGTAPQIAGLALGVDGQRLRLGGLELESFAVETRSSQLDLSLAMAEVEGGLAVQWRYDSDLFDPVTVERLAGQLEVLLEALAEDPARRLSELPVGSAAERAQLLYEWNDTAQLSAGAATLGGRLAAAAAAWPHQTAVVAGDAGMTYTELLARGAALGRKLEALGVEVEDEVGVLLGPSLELPVALLAVLGAGAAHLPLDPSYPAERLALMLEDARPAVVLTTSGLLGRLPAGPWRPLCMDGLEPAGGADSPPALPSRAFPESLAYVIYTSGSTGRPKGVQIPHSAIVNFLQSMAARPGLSPDDVLLAVTPLSFDICALEIFLPLLTGARVVLAPREVSGDGLCWPG